MPIARWARVCACRLGPDAQEAARVDPGDGAAACANLRDIDGGHLEHITAALDEAAWRRNAIPKLVLCRERRHAIEHERCLRGRAAHVKDDQFPFITEFADLGRTRNTTRRARGHCEDGLLRCLGDAHHAAVRRHDLQRRGDAHRAQVFVQPSQVGAHGGQDVRVHNRGAGALVLLDFGEYVARRADLKLRIRGFDQVACTPLVIRVDVAVDKADRECLNALSHHLADDADHLGFIKGCHHVAVRIHALAYAAPVSPWGQRLWLAPRQVEHGGRADAADFQDIPEPFGREHAGHRADLLQNCVGSRRSAVDNLGNVGRRYASLANQRGKAGNDGLAEVVGSRRCLVHEEPTIGHREHDVCECSADVASDAHPARDCLLVLHQSFTPLRPLPQVDCDCGRGSRYRSIIDSVSPSRSQTHSPATARP